MASPFSFPSEKKFQLGSYLLKYCFFIKILLAYKAKAICNFYQEELLK